jgi:azurin
MQFFCKEILNLAIYVYCKESNVVLRHPGTASAHGLVHVTLLQRWHSRGKTSLQPGQFAFKKLLDRF